MKIPMTPPNVDKMDENDLRKIFTFAFQGGTAESRMVVDGKYRHWEKLRHLTPPTELSNEQWWYAIKLARRALYRRLPFVDKHQRSFVIISTLDLVMAKLNFIDRNLGNVSQGPGLALSQEEKKIYLIRSLREEAITSSQLEGASTTRRDAEEMLRTERKPRDHSEQMIFNNYRAMQFVREVKNNKLTPEIILELHRLLTEDTLEVVGDVGKLRSSDDIHIYDEPNQILHTPPHHQELPKRLKTLCDFANEEDERHFIHPVIKAILLHFQLAYDHPFVDGNGRTARALFYWCMANQKYWLMEFLSISHVIQTAPTQYARSYLFTETDDNDTTYFVLHQLKVIEQAITHLQAYLKEKEQQTLQVDELIAANPTLENQLNQRQIALLVHAVKHPNEKYVIEKHRRYHSITYETARTDLLGLAKLGLLEKRKHGKAFVFLVMKELVEKIKKMSV